MSHSDPPLDSLEYRCAAALGAACMAYIADLEVRPFRTYWNRHAASLMPFEAFEAHAFREHWYDKRLAFQKAVVEEVIQRMRKEFVEQETKMLEALEAMRKDALDLIRPEWKDGEPVYRVQPSSLEGMMNAIMRLSQSIERKQASYLRDVQAAREIAFPTRHPSARPMSEEEQRDLMELIRNKYREKARAQYIEFAKTLKPKP